MATSAEEVVEASILVIEDSPKMRELILRCLVEDGYAADAVATGIDGVASASHRTLEAIILDLGLPDIDGIEVCRQIRAAGQWAPILILTARDAVEDRVHGLDAGADDYLSKPFAVAELTARLRALIRRGQGHRPTIIEVGDLTFDPASREVRRRGILIELTPKEFLLLEILLRRRGEVVSRSLLTEHAWDWAYDGVSNVVDVHIASLRSKIDRPFGTRSVETCRGIGYRFVGEGEPR